MKKDKLIAMLTAISGNPKIKLWNGLVGDWVDINTTLVPVELVRMTKEYWIESCRLETCRDRKDWEYQFSPELIKQLTKQYTTVCTWEDNQYVTQEDIIAKRYDARTVQILQSKIKGKTSWDRLGKINY